MYNNNNKFINKKNKIKSQHFLNEEDTICLIDKY